MIYVEPAEDKEDYEVVHVISLEELEDIFKEVGESL